MELAKSVLQDFHQLPMELVENAQPIKDSLMEDVFVLQDSSPTLKEYAPDVLMFQAPSQYQETAPPVQEILPTTIKLKDADA